MNGFIMESLALITLSLFLLTFQEENSGSAENEAIESAIGKIGNISILLKEVKPPPALIHFVDL